MKMKTTTVSSLALLSIAMLTASCGGSDESKGDGDSSSHAGKSGAGTGGAAGQSSSSGGSKSGGTSSGGSAGRDSTGGRNNGGFSFGGVGGFDPGELMCDPAPQPGADCEDGTTPCLDGTSLCICRNGEWGCSDLGGGLGGSGGAGIGQIECPATKPMNDTDCGSSFGVCPYGGDNMGCVCFGGNWACN